LISPLAKTKNSPKNQKLNYALAHALARVLTHRMIHLDSTPLNFRENEK
jgi:hypothetical protein